MQTKTAKCGTKFLALLLVVLMLLTMLPISALAANEEGATDVTTQDVVYQISNVDELVAFADKVNGGETTISAELTADIDLSSVENWTAIGTEAQPFAGSFDGNGHTIKNMTITYAETSVASGTKVYLGLFGNVIGSADEKAEIKNLTLTGEVDITENYSNSGYGTRVGGLCGYIKDASCTDVNVDVAFSAKLGSYKWSWDYLGGFASKAENVEFTRCVNNGTIYSEGEYVGGFCGESKNCTYTSCVNHGDITAESRPAGISAAISDGTTMTNCYNSGAIGLVKYDTGDSLQDCGGLAARASGVGTTVTACYNAGSVTGGVYVGGLVGNITSGARVVDCYNVGAVTGHSTKNYGGIGGLIGNMQGGMQESNMGFLVNSFNVGAVSDEGTKDYPCGAAIGMMHSDYSNATTKQYENVYYIACDLDGVGYLNAGTLDYPENMVEKTAEELAAPEFATALGENFVVGTDGYPVLTWQVSEAPAIAGYLSDLTLSLTSNSGECELDPVFEADQHDYIVKTFEQSTSIYVRATLSEDAPEGATIVAGWTNLYNGKAQTATLTSGATGGTSLANFGRDGKTNTLTVTVGTEEDVQVYTVNSVRIPSLKSLSVDGADMNESFVYSTMAYTADTTEETVTIDAISYTEGNTVTYNGETANEIALEKGENVVEIAVSNGDDTTTYTMTITRHDTRSMSIQATPADAMILLIDNYNNRVMPDADGVYKVGEGYTYTCTVTAFGYVGQQCSFAVDNETTDMIVTLEKAAANDTINADISAEWPNFRNGSNHLGITEAKTPYTAEDTELLWAVQYGTGGAAAPGSPIIVDNYLVTYSGSSIKKLDMNTGAVVAEGTMAGSTSYSIVPATYADGMIFVSLSGGRIQAFNADTLESLWIYTDALKGQSNCPITYDDGYVYVGFWNSETKDANFVCVNVTDEDPEATDEAKLASWTYTRAGGFYWAGAYVSEQYAVVGTDDGASGYNTEGASLLVLDKKTGVIVDSWDGIRGDIRSNVSYDPQSDRVFFTSKGGVLCNAQIDWKTGKINSKHSTVIQDSQGNENAMSTCTPSVYNGRIYIGVAGTSQFGSNSGHGIAVYSLEADGTMTQAYVYDIVGYPQTSAMLTTAYMEEEGYVYVYLPYNMTPGGISVLKDKPGQTEPMATTDSGYSEIFTPESPLSQYCICSTIADSYGTVYYKNDSCYMMALTSRIEGIEITEQPSEVTKNDDGTYTATGMKVVANLANGLQRDVTDYVTIEERDGILTVVYTYGFDSANYGLKEQTAVFYEEDNTLYGDVDGNGTIDFEDGDLVWSYFVNYYTDDQSYPLTEDQLKAADVNGDGIVDNYDALLIYAYKRGKITAFPVQQ